ncbi:MAG: helix-turn-helix domain-containing protein [Candidatus Methylomirabilales bacterium]
MAATASWKPAVSEKEAKSARLSPRLIQKLRVRLGLSQRALAQIVGVSAAAVLGWERGRSTASGEHRAALVGLRKLGRRDVRRLLAQARTAQNARPVRRRQRRKTRARRSRRPKQSRRGQKK